MLILCIVKFFCLYINIVEIRWYFVIVVGGFLGEDLGLFLLIVWSFINLRLFYVKLFVCGCLDYIVYTNLISKKFVGVLVWRLIFREYGLFFFSIVIETVMCFCCIFSVVGLFFFYFCMEGLVN